jgi:hypothetical protein
MGKYMKKQNQFKISFCARERFSAHFCATTPSEHSIKIKKYERRQRDEQQQFERHQLPKQFFTSRTIALTELDRQERGMTRAHPDSERAKKHHQRKRQRESGHRIFATALADVKSIDHGIKRVETHRHQCRPRILEE